MAAEFWGVDKRGRTGRILLGVSAGTLAVLFFVGLAARSGGDHQVDWTASVYIGSGGYEEYCDKLARRMAVTVYDGDGATIAASNDVTATFNRDTYQCALRTAITVPDADMYTFKATWTSGGEATASYSRAQLKANGWTAHAPAR